jgi:hypothetical protein
MFGVQSVWYANLKDVELYGVMYTVPKSMGWVAVNKNGEMYCHKKRPRKSRNENTWVGGGTRYYIGIASYTGEWTESIAKIKEGKK